MDTWKTIKSYLTKISEMKKLS